MKNGNCYWISWANEWKFCLYQGTVKISDIQDFQYFGHKTIYLVLTGRYNSASFDCCTSLSVSLQKSIYSTRF